MSRLASAVFRLLLHALPSDVREGDGSEMEETHLARLRDRAGLGAKVRFLIAEWTGLLRCGWTERVGRGFGLPTPWGDPRRFDPSTRRWRLAARSLAVAPGFAVPAAATLALGLGTGVATWTVVDDVLLRPLPYPAPEELVVLDHAAAGIGADRGVGLAPGIVHHVRSGSRTLVAVAAWSEGNATVTDGFGTALRLRSADVTPSIREVLRVEPLLGRWFRSDERDEEVVVLSHRAWKGRFGGDPSILERRVRIAGVEHEVVGVLPVGFDFPSPAVDLWRPLAIDETTEFGGFWLSAVARRAPGIDDAAVLRELRGLQTRLGDSFPGKEAMLTEILEGAGLAPLVRPLREEVLGGIEPLLLAVLGAAGLVLLVVAADVANLALVRASRRRRDRAVRRALGASRFELFADAVAEAVLLAMIGGTAAGAVAFAAVRALVRFGPEDLPRLHEVEFGADSVGVLVLLAGATAIGLATLARLGRDDGPGFLRAARGAAPTLGRRTVGRRALVTVQIAMALVLTVGAGLLVRTFFELRSLELGFEATEDIRTFRVALSDPHSATRASAAGFAEQLRQRLGGLPGVESVGLLTCLPLDGWCTGDPLRVEGRPESPTEVPPVVALRRAGPDAFEALGIRVVAGRAFTPADHLGAGPATVVVSEEMARLYFPGEDPLGRRIRPPGSDEDSGWHTIIGVVADTPARAITEPALMAYFPLAGTPLATVGSDWFAVAVRGGDVSAETVRALVHELAPSAPVSHFATTRGLVRDALARLTLVTTLLLGMALVGILLAAVGVFGVVAVTVAERRGELGVRIALGAGAREIRLLVLRGGLGVLGLGLGGGALVAAFGTRVLRSLLHGVEPGDPWTLVGAALLLASVALLAADGPARRAARTDPVEALRAD